MKRIRISILFVFCCVFFLSGCYNAVLRHDSRKYALLESGEFETVVPVPVKNFVSKGIVFVESKVTIDVNGERNGSEITNEMLMREADKLGADDIINVRIDKIEDHKIVDKYEYETYTRGRRGNKASDNDSSEGTFIGRKYIEKNYIYKATALAIKYVDTPISISVSEPAKDQTGRVHRQGRAKIRNSKDLDIISSLKKEKNNTLSNLDLDLKLGIAIHGTNKNVDTDSDDEFKSFGCELDLAYFINDYFGFGSGIEFSKRDFNYYDPYSSGYYGKEEYVITDYFATLNGRIDNFYAYIALGTKIGAGIGCEFNNFLAEIALNDYLERYVGGQNFKQASLNFSIGYRFKLL